MNFEDPADLARINNPEAFSLDSNTFERTLIFDRLSEMSARIYSENEIDSQDSLEILEAMDQLATIGYFCSNDSEANRSVDDWKERGIDPKNQIRLETKLLHQNMEVFETLLQHIYAARIKPVGFIDALHEKVNQQVEKNVGGSVKIVMELNYLDTVYKQE
jgi:hypothetical protein